MEGEHFIETDFNNHRTLVVPQGNIAVDTTYVGPPNAKGDAPRVNCPGDKAANCTVSGTVFMPSSDVATWPPAAQAIVANAGP